MKTIELKTNNLEQIFNQLREVIGGHLEISHKEYLLTLENTVAKGEIKGVIVNNIISFIEYNVTFHNDTIILKSTPFTNPIQFLYCAEGQISHSFGLNSKLRGLNQYQTGIFASDPNKSSCLYFRKDQAVKISIISVQTQPKNKGDKSLNLLQNRLIDTFMPNKGQSIFAYTGSYNVKIADKMHQLETIKQDGIVRRLLIKGIVHMILGLEIEQHNNDKKNSETNFGSLTKVEMSIIRELTVFIQNYPELKYTLKYLSMKAGLSPAKLQEGFKILHNRTVADFIRHTRVERAEKLLKTTDLNISEIVYTVGLTSRSYFSKIFKEKYNCSPKYYQDHQNQVAVTA